MSISGFREKYRNISIKWKIFVYLIGFCTLLLILLWLFQIVFLDSFYKNIKIKEVKKTASIIMKNIDNENIGEIIENLSVSNDVCVEVLSENGTVLYSSDVLTDCIIHKMPQFEKMRLVNQTVENGGELLGYYNRGSFFGNVLNRNRFGNRELEPNMNMNLQETIIYSKIITDKNGDKIILFLNSVISPVEATVKTLYIQLYYITGFMIIFSIILALLIAKRVSRPIEELNDSTKKLAIGDYNVKFDASGYKEIKELSKTLTYTASELSKVDRLKNELIANISHDLRTPLTLISGYAEAMRDLPNESTPENAQIIVDEAQRLTTLVNDVLDISKIQAGKEVLNVAPFNLTEMINIAIKRMREMVKNLGYKIEFEYDKQVNVIADETKIYQAFYNLLINAINYTGFDKIVEVHQIVEGDTVKIEVKDTGEGVSEENLPYIWDRYYKIEKTHKRAVAGTGIGLSIVKSVIEMHGGKYGVVSKTNEGSTFWFSLNIKN